MGVQVKPQVQCRNPLFQICHFELKTFLPRFALVIQSRTVGYFFELSPNDKQYRSARVVKLFLACLIDCLDAGFQQMLCTF